MDIETGKIYPSEQDAIRDMLANGVPEEKISGRLVFGEKKTLRKLRKMIRNQEKRKK